jgi:hypothetical protein
LPLSEFGIGTYTEDDSRLDEMLSEVRKLSPEERDREIEIYEREMRESVKTLKKGPIKVGNVTFNI